MNRECMTRVQKGVWISRTAETLDMIHLHAAVDFDKLRRHVKALQLQ